MLPQPFHISYNLCFFAKYCAPSPKLIELTQITKTVSNENLNSLPSIHQVWGGPSGYFSQLQSPQTGTWRSPRHLDSQGLVSQVFWIRIRLDPFSYGNPDYETDPGNQKNSQNHGKFQQKINQHHKCIMQK